jgi:hypothetical protein
MRLTRGDCGPPFANAQFLLHFVAPCKYIDNQAMTETGAEGKQIA